MRKRSPTDFSSSTTLSTTGMPSFIRMASITRSGSPGMRTFSWPGAGLAWRKRVIQLSMCSLNSSAERKASVRIAPKKWPRPVPGIFSGIGTYAGNGGAQGP